MEFKTAMKNLLDHAEKILEAKASQNTFATARERKKDPLKKCLSNYRKDFESSSEEDNKEDVVLTYRKFRIMLLKGPAVDEWLLKGKAVAIYSAANDPDEKHKIPLSTLYNTACTIRDKLKESLAGLPVEAYSAAEELLYPSFLQLYMYQVFLLSLSGEEFGDDITKLTKIADSLDKEIRGIAVTGTAPAETISVLQANPMLEGIFGLAKDTMTKMGIDLPTNIDPSAANFNIADIAGTIFSRPETKDLMSNFGNVLKDSRDIGDAFQKAFSVMQDPKTVDTLKKVFVPAVETVAEQP